MVLDWLSRAGPPPHVDDLAAEGRYAQAVAVLRAELQSRTPTLAERLRLADLLGYCSSKQTRERREARAA